MVLSDDSRCCTATPSSAAANSAAASSDLICMDTAKGQPSLVNKKNLQQKIALPGRLRAPARAIWSWDHTACRGWGR